jgi:ABC-type nitrate/sulfonate/bicarbonate transport system permease component
VAVPGRQGLTAAAAATAPPLPARLPRRRRVNPWVVRAVAFACLLAAWQLASTCVPGAALLLPAPLRIVSVYVDLLRSGELVVHSAASLGRVLAGTAVAAAVALPLGVLIGWFPTFGYAADVVVEMLRPIPPIAWIPLSILWFGIGSGAAVFIIVVGAFFPLLLNTVLGVKGVPRGLLEAARVLGVRRRDQLFWKVVLPAALPAVITGLRISLGIAWMCVVASEMVSITSGLGYLIMDARMFYRTDVVLAGMFTIGLLGLAINALMRAFERRVQRYRGAAA